MHHSACRVISCNYQPRFLVAVRDSITMPFEWYMPLQHTPHSGVLAWPVNIIKMKPGIHIVEFKAPAHDDMKPHVLPIMGISSGLIKAAPFHWKSWLWQCHHADGRGKLKPGVRPVILGQLENDVATVASKKAWFSVGSHRSHFDLQGLLHPTPIRHFSVCLVFRNGQVFLGMQ